MDEFRWFLSQNWTISHDILYTLLFSHAVTILWKFREVLEGISEVIATSELGLDLLLN